MMDKDIDGIIQEMRKAKTKYCAKHDIDEAFYVADITIYSTTSDFSAFMKKVDGKRENENKTSI